MTRSTLFIGILSALAFSFGCNSGSVLTEAEREKLETLVLTSDMAIPPSPTNRFADSPAAAALGQKIFFDPRFSGPLVVGNDGSNGGLGMVGEPDKISCRSCHDMANGAHDSRSRPNNTSLGFKFTPRNSPTMYNMPWLTFNHLDGRKHTIWGGSTAPIEGALGSTRLKVAHRMQEIYAEEFEAVFGVPITDFSDYSRFPEVGKPGQPAWDDMAAEDKDKVLEVLSYFGKAIEAYLRHVIDWNSPFDRYMRGADDSLSPSAIRGMKLFVGKAACDECHSGATLSDREFHNIGVSQVGMFVMARDPGRANGINQVLKDPLTGVGKFSDDPEALRAEIDKLEPVPQELIPNNCEAYPSCGAFKTPSLRSVDRTAPYMHTGSIATLREVVEFYNSGGGADGYAGTRDVRIVPLGLTEQEVTDLVAFLSSLSGQPIPEQYTEMPELPPLVPTSTVGI